jgi:hypothetical protein
MTGRRLWLERHWHSPIRELSQLLDYLEGPDCVKRRLERASAHRIMEFKGKINDPLCLPVCATQLLCGSEAEREAGRKFGSFSEKDAKNAKYAMKKQQQVFGITFFKP